MSELRTPDDVGAADPNEADPPSKLDPGLHIVATPIGNLADLSPRAARVLAEADLVVCEDTRVTGKLLAKLALRRRLAVYNEHTAVRVRPMIIAQLQAGASVALVSDAGTPCISDPGYKLVRAARELGLPVHAVPGPSAVVAALSVAGLPTDRFLFLGFLPPRQAARRSSLAEIAAVRATLVILEAPPRLADLLADAAEVLGDREAAIARELTKLFEEVRRDSLAELARHYAAADAPKGEIVVLVGPPRVAAEPDPEEVDMLLTEAASDLPPRRAAALVAERTGLSANRLYERLLVLRRGSVEPG